MKLFHSTDVLIPKTNMEKWSVIACDQFTSQPQYWDKVRNNTEGEVSTINLILPESQIENASLEDIKKINDTMYEYLEKNIFEEYVDALIYVERTLLDGSQRCGIMGAIDLEEYEYVGEKKAAIRATEETVVERIPIRVAIRENAPIEIPHIILLCDDEEEILIKPFATSKNQFRKLYEFDLMEQGGHIVGWLINEEAKEIFMELLKKYEDRIRQKYKSIDDKPMYFAVGDGNHSLATAKACYEKEKKQTENNKSLKSRFAMVELENIHSNALCFEPIHRLISNVDVNNLLSDLEKEVGAVDGYKVSWYSNNQSGTISLDKSKHYLAIGVLQDFLDKYMKDKNGTMDYIHGKDAIMELSRKENTVAFILPEIDKRMLFRSIMADGSLPRKTFSIGHAVEKRYYLEARKIL